MRIIKKQYGLKYDAVRFVPVTLLFGRSDLKLHDAVLSISQFTFSRIGG